jgi:hypothetical protein
MLDDFPGVDEKDPAGAGGQALAVLAKVDHSRMLLQSPRAQKRCLVASAVAVAGRASGNDVSPCIFETASE